jgi:hypothetical protein
MKFQKYQKFWNQIQINLNKICSNLIISVKKIWSLGTASQVLCRPPTCPFRRWHQFSQASEADRPDRARPGSTDLG